MADRILVAEDKENLCRLIETTLSEAGYDVSIALGGDAAIHEIRSRQFDVVISDMRMPGASGIHVFREARAQSYLPDVILMTAFADTREAVQMMKEGAADYIVKDNILEELPLRSARCSRTGSCVRNRASSRAGSRASKSRSTSTTSTRSSGRAPRCATRGA